MAEFNPVLVKEMRGRMRGTRAFVLLTAYLAVLSGVTLLTYLGVSSSISTRFNAGQQIGQALFYTIVTVALIQVCVITPLLTAGSIATEKERQTYDLLVSSLLSPWQIIWGKLASALAFALVLVLGVVPLMSLAFLFGGVSLSEIVIALVGLLTTAVFYASIGVFWSAVMRTSLGANSLAIGTVLVMLVGVPFLWLISSLIARSADDFWTSSVASAYLGGAFLCLHPFIALIFSDVILRDGRGPFLFSIDLQNGASVLAPMPWLGYVIVAVVASAVLLLLTVRMIRPDAATHGSSTRKQSAPQTPSASS